jgi:integrase
MGTIDERDGRKLRIRARWSEPDGTQRAKHFATREEAAAYLRLIDSQLRHGLYRPAKSSKSMMHVYIRNWMANQMTRPSTVDRITSLCEYRLIPRFGRFQIGSVTTAEIQKWIHELQAEGLAPSTINSYYRLFSSLMLGAVREGLIERSPCQFVKLPRIDNDHSVVRPLTPDDVRRIATAVDDRFYALIIVMSQLGLRIGEACGLTWDRVDLVNRSVVIDRQMVTPSKGSPVLGPPKTKSSNRRLPLSQTAHDALVQHRQKYPPGPAGLVFTSSRGNGLGRTTFGGVFRDAARKVGIEATSHDLRHHCASLLIGAGCPVTTVQHFLGHKNASETLDTYAHLWAQDDDRIRHALDTQFGT